MTRKEVRVSSYPGSVCRQDGKINDYYVQAHVTPHLNPTVALDALRESWMFASVVQVINKLKKPLSLPNFTTEVLYFFNFSGPSPLKSISDLLAKNSRAISCMNV